MLEAANKALIGTGVSMEQHSEHSSTLLIEPDFFIDDPVVHSRDVIKRLSQFIPLVEQQHQMNSLLDNLLPRIDSLKHLTGKILIAPHNGIRFFWSYHSPPIMVTTEYMVFTAERLTIKQAFDLEKLLFMFFTGRTTFLASIEA